MSQLSGNALHENRLICAARLDAPIAQGLPDHNVYFAVCVSA